MSECHVYKNLINVVVVVVAHVVIALTRNIFYLSRQIIHVNFSKSDFGVANEIVQAQLYI